MGLIAVLHGELGMLQCFMNSMSPYSDAPAPPQVESKAQVAKRRREAQQEFLYTIPVAPQVRGTGGWVCSTCRVAGGRVQACSERWGCR